MSNNENQHVCPVWAGYLLASPIRKVWQNPESLLSPYIEKGMTILDIGSAMGFFSLPMAHMTGKNGKVICVDLQEKMLIQLAKRAERKGLSSRILTRQCSSTDLNISDLKEQIDFAIAIAVVHEVPDQSGFFRQIFYTLKKGAKLLVAEPTGHVTREAFEQSVIHMQEAGFKVLEYLDVRRSWTVVVERGEG